MEVTFSDLIKIQISANLTNKAKKGLLKELSKNEATQKHFRNEQALDNFANNQFLRAENDVNRQTELFLDRLSTHRESVRDFVRARIMKKFTLKHNDKVVWVQNQ